MLTVCGSAAIHARLVQDSPVSAEGSLLAVQGYVNTAACKSTISFIDGDKGILRYRGYPIEQLAERSNYTEVCSCTQSGSL